MIDYLDVDAKLEEYSEAFDIYMDSGQMPPSISADDCLAGYMRQVIDDNPQIDGSDPTWAEVLKESLISYFTALLEQFRAMQIEAMKELALIAKFRNAEIEGKREMWSQVYGVISNGYSKFDVNLLGYVKQLSYEEKEAVFAALTADWENACKKRLSQKQRQMLERSQRDFEIHSRYASTADYEKKKRIENFVYKYPQLKEIIDKIGRDSTPTNHDTDSIINKFLPTTVAKNNSAAEIDRVEFGHNLERVLPIELSMPDDLFFKRYVTNELQQFSSPGKDKPKKVEEHRKDPRLTKGPIIVSIDTSGSMHGRPEKIALSLLRQLLVITKRQKRPCFLISFSVRAKSIDLSKPRNWSKLDSFLDKRFSGGTYGEEMLSEALRVLQKGTFEMADVLLISDLQFAPPKQATQEKINKEKSFGTRFYALQIGKLRHYYDNVMDQIWQI